MEIVETADYFEPIQALRKDIRQAVMKLSPNEVRYLVDLYYQIQDFRKIAQQQIGSMEDEPTDVLSWAYKNMEQIEKSIRGALGYYTDNEPTGMGAWSKAIVGIGPVIAAGLVANIDVTKCRTAAGLWRFCGLDPTIPSHPVKGEKLKYSKRMKVLCWKIGQSFLKTSGKEDGFYGHLYLERKAYEWEKNLTGDYSDRAKRIFAEKKFGKSRASLWYGGKVSAKIAKQLIKTEKLETVTATKEGDEIPMLPPAAIDARARRWAVKIFLCHYFEEAYRCHYKKEPPTIYSIAMLGHTKKIEAEESRRK